MPRLRAVFHPSVPGVEAVLWMARNGARWRALPKAYGDWHSVYVRFALWAKAGIWNRLFEARRSRGCFCCWPTSEKKGNRSPDK
jgi:transposase